MLLLKVLFAFFCSDFSSFTLTDCEKIDEGEARELIGVRAIHKLAISCTSSSSASQHNFNETMNVMKMAVHPRHWNFVVFKTLMRLATKNDRIRRKAVQVVGECSL
jgi:hypothetical protein